MKGFLPVNPYRGTRDFLPEEMAVRQAVFSRFYEVIETFGFQRYDGPILEPAEIYEAKSGREIADQQLYTLVDRGGRRLALRPEMTPSVARIVARFAGSLDFPLRWYCHVNCHRYERPQRGRVREHWQINCDIFGSDSEECEVEIFDLVHSLMASAGATKDQYRLRVNCRVLMESALRHLVGASETILPEVFSMIDRWEKVDDAARDEGLVDAGLSDSQIRTLRHLLRGEPSFVADLPAEEIAGSNVAKLLRSGERTLFCFDPSIIRAFEYYTSTVFEVFDASPDNRRSLFGGGRYSDLAGLFTPSKIPGIGFGMGDVTVFDFLSTHGLLPAPQLRPDVAVIGLDGAPKDAVRLVARQLRTVGIRTVLPLVDRSASAELRRAGKGGSPIAVLIAAAEWDRGMTTVRDLRSGDQSELPVAEVVSHVRQLLG